MSELAKAIAKQAQDIAALRARIDAQRAAIDAFIGRTRG